jgi:hypothetical protein
VSARLTPWLVLAAVTVAGLVVRTIPVAAADFPVNDGGLFVAMTRAIGDAGWALPEAVAWNGADLPFVYPPIAFYQAGLLETVFGLDLYGVFRWFPLLYATLVVPAVYLLGRSLLRSDLGGAAAALAYALAPASFVWLVQGGGVTRAPGMVVAVLTLWQFVALVREPTRGRTVLVGALAGLTALVHPGAALFTAVSAFLISLFEARTRRSLAHAAAAAGIGLLVTAPWLAIVVSRHGLAAVLDAPSNGPDPGAALLAVLAARFTGAPFTDPLAVIGLAFAILCLLRRRFLLPLWFGIGIALSYQYAMVPFGLLIGAAAIDLAASRQRLGARAVAADPAANSPAIGHARWVPRIGLAILAAALAVEGWAGATAIANPGAPLHALSPERREAMATVAAELPPDARVAVITDSVWSGDPDSEWFPWLTGRRSVATVQGSEWLGTAAFDEQVRAHRALQACVEEATVACIEDWLAVWPADYLYLPMGPLHGTRSPEDCCAALRAALAADDGFDVAYDGPGATILSVVD